MIAAQAFADELELTDDREAAHSLGRISGRRSYLVQHSLIESPVRLALGIGLIQREREEHRSVQRVRQRVSGVPGILGEVVCRAELEGARIERQERLSEFRHRLLVAWRSASY